MPSQHRTPPRDSRDRDRERDRDQRQQRSPRSPPSKNRSLATGGKTTLPSIKDILPDIDRPSTNGREPLQSLRINPEGPNRSPASRTRLTPPISPAQPSDRRTSNDGHLPIRTGPPVDRSYSTSSGTRWSDQPSRSSVAQSVYTVHAPIPPSVPSPSYSYASHPPESSRNGANGGSNLPPPPPPYKYARTNGQSPYTASYSATGGYTSGHAYYSNENRDPRYVGPSGASGPAHMHVPASAPPPSSPRGPYEQHPGPSVYGNGYTNGHSPTNGYQYYDTREPEPTRKRRGNLPRYVTDMLKQWFLEHIAHPYPTEQEKNDLCRATGLGMTQISNWFINARRRQAPALQMQAHAETTLRQNSGGSNSNSE